ncbi:MAG: BPL-N domain-containing protein [Bacteroidales bacterium]
MRDTIQPLSQQSFRALSALLLIWATLLGCEKERLAPSALEISATTQDFTNLQREEVNPLDKTLLSAVSESRGFYKDLFMDGGIRLTSRRTLPAAANLLLNMEYFASSATDNLNLQDTLLQDALYCGSPEDYNGVLLYPDGAPRFKTIYVNGGSATAHGNSLTERGRENFRAYVANGGSYVGTCAGMFLACKSTYSYGPSFRESYLHIWPGYARSTGLSDTYTGHFVEPGSPLLNYSNFGGDMYIDNIYHNGGGFAYEPWGFPAETQVLLRYDYPKLTPNGSSIHNQPSAWAYKANEESGRIVVIGSHPEGITSGERLDLMSAMVQYAIDGVGGLHSKGRLVKGVTRSMDRRSEDNDPLYTKIGDRQYHHFSANIPSRAKNIEVTLEGTPGYLLNLFMKRGSFASAQNATYFNNSNATTKTIELESIEPGEWYISVFCATTVETKKVDWGTEYIGNLGVLNGVPYTIKIDWE